MFIVCRDRPALCRRDLWKDRRDLFRGRGSGDRGGFHQVFGVGPVIAHQIRQIPAAPGAEVHAGIDFMAAVGTK